MVAVGVHVSIAGSIDRAVDRAQKLGCDTFQIFTRNPRGWRFKDLTPEQVEKFTTKIERSGIYPPVAHAPYLPNLASPKEDGYSRSVDALASEVLRCSTLHIPYLVTHLGSHLGTGTEGGVMRIISAVSTAIGAFEEARPEGGGSVMILLENTAGTKNSVGGRFEEIGRIIDGVKRDDLVGVCFDTCHAFAAGYELRTADTLDATMALFDETIGLDRLKLIHLNDSKGGLNSRLDRHEHIGMGYIREDGFKVILHHDAIRKLPMILETPVDARRDDVGNIRMARMLAEG
ncbi:MAG: endonuclease [Candidatus Methanogaster sp.]|uniref:Endonuclease n=1 Tax=Candidatus Methanogaster sp. TaxID=3386292 RepID=A0AC61L546_9EURY|nr:MAG: endonuclease [ANME-2 cluster archaeon]